MDPQPDMIRQQIDETRSHLTEQLETLEAEVKGTVRSAKETVENVKESVHNAKETVKRTFDIPYQVDRHPWGMMGLSLLSGAIAGALLGGRMNTSRRIARRMSEVSRELPERGDGALAALSRPAHDGASQRGFVDRLTDKLGDEFEKVKDLAIDAMVGVVGDVAHKAIPALRQAAEDMMTRTVSEVGAPPPHYGEERGGPATDSGYQPPQS
jgi:ElaB/YqjD/DUF883 family membrane-anchored ribosome-binding protein